MELSTAQKVIIASVVILVLLALLGLFVRQIQGGRLRVPGQAGGRQRQPRLGIVDTYDLDRQRQLVLIRRDNVEHLLMVGGASDVVVESNIMRGASRSTTPLFNEQAPPDRPLPPFETLVPPSEPALRAGEELRRTIASPEPSEMPPSIPMRPVQVPVEPAVAAGIGVAAALGVEAPTPAKTLPAAPVASAPPLAGPPPSFAREHAPAPVVSPGELDDMTRQLEAALKRPFSAVRPAQLAESPETPTQAPEPAPPRSMPIPERAKPPEPRSPAPGLAAAKPNEVKPNDARLAEVRPAEVRPPEVKPVVPKPAESAPAAAPIKPRAMLDMEAELEAALGLKPKPAEARSTEPKAPEAQPNSSTGPRKGAEPPHIETAPAVTKPTEPEIVVPPPAPKPGPVERSAQAVIEDAPAADTTDSPAEAEIARGNADETERSEPSQAKPDQGKPDAPKPADAGKELDPFSVDAIEAEFARLLGRDPKAKS